jgi:hypothetical protein
MTSKIRNVGTECGDVHINVYDFDALPVVPAADRGMLDIGEDRTWAQVTEQPNSRFFTCQQDSIGASEGFFTNGYTFIRGQNQRMVPRSSNSL